MRVLGLDPGLRNTGWGVIEADGNHLRHLGNGVVVSDAKADLAERLLQLHRGIAEVVESYAPDFAAVEVTLANKNPSSTLKLGMARGIALLTPALAGLPVAEYLPMIVKKAVVGTGHADKKQVEMMVGRLLPGCAIAAPDAADALAVAICHSHHHATGRRWAAGSEDPLKTAPRAASGPGRAVSGGSL
ncbi:crossover junction endodeoxyribonuclease RuvC [Pelagibius litoralis]|uniref:Crossover junction endodeoxyribonuclease RuvC n=1 Tax=Pelagibius litoralis TaxID=374515 RepID=A0A967KAI4_9PROT|nr:crossover junction endodeoxyribonuclease RuvC [Pelagibius litoralis]NIA70497.1 crossover junction endodeoxyribonuclease RuvC [Pelagibius litoralis]